MDTNRHILNLPLILAVFAVGLLGSSPTLAQTERASPIQLRFAEDLVGRTVDLRATSLQAILTGTLLVAPDPAHLPLDPAYPRAIVLSTALMQGNAILSQRQSIPFSLERGSYIVSDSEGDIFTLDPQGSQNEERGRLRLEWAGRHPSRSLFDQALSGDSNPDQWLVRISRILEAPTRVHPETGTFDPAVWAETAATLGLADEQVVLSLAFYAQYNQSEQFPVSQNTAFLVFEQGTGSR